MTGKGLLELLENEKGSALSHPEKKAVRAYVKAVISQRLREEHAEKENEQDEE